MTVLVLYLAVLWLGYRVGQWRERRKWKDVDLFIGVEPLARDPRFIADLEVAIVDAFARRSEHTMSDQKEVREWD